MSDEPKWKKAGSVGELAAQDAHNFGQWKKGPSGLSAMGFGRVTKPGIEENRELRRMVEAKKRGR